MIQPAFLYNPRSPAKGWYCPQWSGPATSVINQENDLTDLLTGPSDGGNFSTESVSLHVTLVYVKLLSILSQPGYQAGAGRKPGFIPRSPEPMCATAPPIVHID